MSLKYIIPLLFIAPAVALSAPVCDDVYPHLPMSADITTEESCTNSGGCWAPVDAVQCYFPKINGYTYSEFFSDGKGTTVGNLTLISPSGALSGDFTDLTIEITQETVSRTHVKIFPTGGNQRWEIPYNVIPRSSEGSQLQDGEEPLTDIFIPSTSPFELGIRRGKQVVFLMSKMLVFQDQYIQTVLSSPSDVSATYGLGESSRLQQAIQYNEPRTLWNVDNAASNLDSSLYGSYPFYVQVLEDGTAFGTALMNSNAMATGLWNADGNPDSLSFQMAGGILDMYVFAGPSPVDVVKQFQELVGLPTMMPYWSLGLHNCKWGYESIEQVMDVVTNYSKAEIPLETQWTDIDYMQNWWDFTTDAETFNVDTFQSFIADLHSKDQHFVPIVDPGIYAIPGEEYDARDKGLEQDVFIKDLTGETNYVGSVWPGPTYFPDWYAANATSYWTEQLVAFHDLLAYDGIWIDMNEVANFENEDGTSQVCVLTGENMDTIECQVVDPNNTFDFPPWQPVTPHGHLGGKTLPMSALHQNGVKEYDTHNLYGLMEAIATNAAVSKATAQRPFVLSRSSAFSSSKHTAHWTGDNAATWNDLAVSVNTMNTLSLFGMMMTGADICGFGDDTTEELCGRWIQSGAFSTFVRNHNSINQEPQEFYLWDSVTKISKEVLQLRYQMLPHLYTLMYRASTEGITVHSPLWINFPSTVTTSGKTDGQFTWSDSVLFTPVLTEGSTSVSGYFPAGVWYPLFTTNNRQSYLPSFGAINTARSKNGGEFVTLDTPFEVTNAHIRGGIIAPMQGEAIGSTAAPEYMTTAAARRAPFSLRVALCSMGGARGDLFLDDGVQQEMNVYTKVAFSARSLTRPLTNQRVVSMMVSTVAGTGPLGAYNLGAEQNLQEIVVNDVNIMSAAGPNARRAAPMKCIAGAAVFPDGDASSHTLLFSDASITGEYENVSLSDEQGLVQYLNLLSKNSTDAAVMVSPLPAVFDGEAGLVRIDSSALDISVASSYIVAWHCA